jgi:hypothetical protein
VKDLLAWTVSVFGVSLEVAVATIDWWWPE